MDIHIIDYSVLRVFESILVVGKGLSEEEIRRARRKLFKRRMGLLRRTRRIGVYKRVE